MGVHVGEMGLTQPRSQALPAIKKGESLVHFIT